MKLTSSLLIFVFAFLIRAEANSCPELEDKPALAIQQELKGQNLLGSGRFLLENESVLNNIFIDYRADPRRQLQFAFTLIRSLRDSKSIEVAERLQREMAQRNLQKKEESEEDNGMYFPESMSESQLIQKVRASLELKPFHDLIMREIVRFKNHYFDPKFVTAVRTDDLYTLNVLVAVAHREAESFIIRMNIDGKRYDLELSNQKRGNTQTPYPIKINEFISPHPPVEIEGAEYNGVPIHFYDLQIMKKGF